MNNTCDANASGAEVATVMYKKGGMVVFLCDHHDAETGPAMLDAGWSAYRTTSAEAIADA